MMKLEYYECCIDDLINYGFIYQNECYQLKKELNHKDVYVVVTYTQKRLKTDVYDMDFHEKYIPYYINTVKGQYVSEIKKEIDDLLQDIIKCCFQNVRVRDQVIEYVKEHYETIIDRPWEKYPDHIVLRNPKQKWYALLTTIPYTSLGIEKEGVLDVINLKNTPEKIEQYIDNQFYFPAYHMNKKYWITIILNKDTDMKTLYEFIEESYSLVK